MKSFAEYMLDQLDIQLPTGINVFCLKRKIYLVFYKCRPVSTGLPFSNQAQNFLTSASALTGQPQINPKILPNAFTLVDRMLNEMVHAGMQCTRSVPSSQSPIEWECHQQASYSMR